MANLPHMLDMTKAHRDRADKLANKILTRGFDLADEEGWIREGVDSSYMDYERMSFCTFRRGDIEYEVAVNSRRVKVEKE